MTTPPFPFRHVLCPTDFSEFSERALLHALSIAQALGGDLTVVYVCPYPVPLGGEVPYYASELLGSVARAELFDKLRAFIAPAAETGVRVRGVLREGDPPRQIARLAQELDADLLVVGTHGRGGFERLLLGSVTEELLRRAPCPLLTVCHGEAPRPGESAVLRRILCATDLRPGAIETVAYATSLAEASSAELRVLHVVEQEADAETARKLMEDALLRLSVAVPQEARRRTAVEERVTTGRAHEEILRAAREAGSQLIVLGARGHGVLDRMLFGSASIQVMRAATCPVLIVGAAARAERLTA